MTVVLSGSEKPSRPGQSILDQAEQRIASQAARPVSPDQLQRAAVEGMLSALDDRWSAYYAAGDFARFEQVLSGRYSGVGMWIRRAHDGRLVVLSVQPASPAADAHVHAGDVLVKVAGRPVTGRSVADVVSDLRGDVGTPVTVTMRRNGQLLQA